MKSTLSVSSLLTLSAFLLMTHLAYADPVTTTYYPDLPGSNNCDRFSNMTRVVKRAIVTYSYTLNKDGKWTQFPDLTLTFNVPFSQFVKVKYNVQTHVMQNSYFLARIKIDGVENIEFRQADGYHTHHSVAYEDEVWL